MQLTFWLTLVYLYTRVLGYITTPHCTITAHGDFHFWTGKSIEYTQKSCDLSKIGVFQGRKNLYKQFYNKLKVERYNNTSHVINQLVCTVWIETSQASSTDHVPGAALGAVPGAFSGSPVELEHARAHATRLRGGRQLRIFWISDREPRVYRGRFPVHCWTNRPRDTSLLSWRDSGRSDGLSVVMSVPCHRLTNTAWVRPPYWSRRVDRTTGSSLGRHSAVGTTYGA